MVVFLTAVIAQAADGVQFDRIFGSHMVLQQGQPIPVWGTAKPGAKVKVTLGAQKQTTQATAVGNWKTTFPALKARGQSLSLSAETTEGKSALNDILVGEVWLCAGQSNMEWNLSQSASARTAIPVAKHKRLRLFNFKGIARGGGEIYSPSQIKRLTPRRFCEGQWQTCSPDSAAEFSAVGYFFGQKLLANLDMPVGLIHVAMGGTPAEAWVRCQALTAHPQLGTMTRGNWLENKSLEPWCRGRGTHNLKRALAANETIPGDGLGPNHSFKPTFMWNAAVAPFTQLPIAGVLWYQGESNAESDWRVNQHDSVLSTLITDWRAQWNQPKLPFLFVQLPAMKRPHWPAFRASQQRVHDALPHTGMAVTIDLGHPTDVHPRDKRPVGERLALIAAKQVYGKSVVASGPVIESAERNGAQLVLQFRSATGLKTEDGEAPNGFEVRDEEGQWHPIRAAIVAGKIELALGQAEATAVRYGWVPFPNPRLNLINAAGLPAAPFAREVLPALRRQNQGGRNPKACWRGAGSTGSPNALLGHLGGGLFGPAAVGGGAGGAGVQDFADAHVQAGQCLGGAFLGKAAHGDEPLRLQDFHHAAQVRIAGGHQRRGLGGGQFVRGTIAAGVFHERQWAVVDDKVIGKKLFGRAKTFAEEAPQSPAAHLTACAGEAVDGALGMFARGFSDGGINADPVAHGGHFTERHAGLRHAEGAGVHAEKNIFLLGAAGQLEVLLVRGPRVIERVVDVLDGLGKTQRLAGGAQVTRGGGQIIFGHKCCRRRAGRFVANGHRWSAGGAPAARGAASKTIFLET